MAVFHITMFSNALHRLTEMTAIVPVEINEGASAGQCPQPEGPMKTVMLLHGFSGTHSDWLFGSRIQQLAMKYHIAVLCPTGENAFYVDDTKRDALYERYLCEVLAFARKVFPLSEKVEDTIIGGLSMGGYGALRNGLRHPELFGGIIALSSALITDALAQQPEIFMACGTEDFLLAANDDFSAYLDSIGVRHTYIKNPGIHDWAFWDAHIEIALEQFFGGAQ